MALRIPPVLLVVIAGLLIWLIARYVPSPPVVMAAQNFVAGLLALVAAVVCLLGIAAFRRARTTVDPLHPEQASALVATGIYRFSRNPMYLGFALILLAWAIFLSAWPGLLVLAGFVAYMNAFQIKPEEKALEARFGESFIEYKQSVRRWL